MPPPPQSTASVNGSEPEVGTEPTLGDGRHGRWDAPQRQEVDAAPSGMSRARCGHAAWADYRVDP
ncbi:hypothetical protein CTE05_01930 [Cellulomonas terrae]|uniref:Uncharacterized protein n=1 Tax=Cellulomonas terrae TaxID=311234 RepID=A0A511JFC2_9CELL|nr:hypothetical protein CTE05_01930 [Cellulomonas terrae]